MMIMRSRSAMPLAVLVAGALGLAACTGGAGAPSAAHPPTGSPHDVLLAAVTRTGSTSAHVELTVSVSGTPSLGLGSASSSAPTFNGTLGAAGDFDFASKTGQMTVTVPPLAGGPGATLQFRVVGQTVYLDVPGIESATGGKPWVELDLSSYEQAVGSNSADPLGGATSGDPTQLLQMLSRIGAQVTEVGPATVDGVPTTEYQASIDLSKAVGGTATASTPGAQIGRQLAQSLLGDIPVSVWVDIQGRARKVTMNLSVLGVHVDMTMGLSDFGEPVTVTPPPADQVADGNALLQGGQLGNILKAATDLTG